MSKLMTGVGDFAVCKNAADQFYVAAKKCKGDNYLDFLSNGFYPYSVNIAFACELYLKDIVIHRSTNDEFIKGHNLKDLFDTLEQVDSQYIENEFTTKLPVKSLNTFLADNGNVFVDWRYALEKTVSIDLTGIEVFADVLKNYVHTLV